MNVSELYYPFNKYSWFLREFRKMKDWWGKAKNLFPVKPFRFTFHTYGKAIANSMIFLVKCNLKCFCYDNVGGSSVFIILSNFS